MIGSMPGALGPPDTQGGQLSDPVSCPQPPRYLNQPGCQAAGWTPESFLDRPVVADVHQA